MRKKRVNNRVRFAGQIVYMSISDTYGTLVIDTGPENGTTHNNRPRMVAFEKVIPILNYYKTGDYVLIDATVQSNKNNPARTIAVNHISRLDPEAPNYNPVNRFDFNGRIFFTEKINDNLAKAGIAVRTGRANYITVYYQSDDKNSIDEFIKTKNELVHIDGIIQTGKKFDDSGKVIHKDRLMVKNFRVFS